MPQINDNSLVTLHYQLGLTDDSILEDTFPYEPMTFQLGSGELARGLELALIGLQIDDEQTVDIGPELAFGFSDETLLRSFPRSDFDPDIELKEGLIVEFSTPGGDTIPGTVLQFYDQEVRADLNHPLAGETIRYRVMIVDVANANEKRELH
jgi:FKBP-type peptidyl-prolyl cis-trans isomerase SlpA